MDRIEQINSLESSITLNDRKNILVTGVKKIDSFSASEFMMDTVLGPLSIKGTDLEIVKLDTYQGNITIKGRLNSLVYSDEKTKTKEESLLGKLFK
jgi:sporulation protein YabP